MDVSNRGLFYVTIYRDESNNGTIRLPNRIVRSDLFDSRIRIVDDDCRMSQVSILQKLAHAESMSF